MSTTSSTDTASMSSYNKAPPKLSTCKSYNDWVKLINIWLALTPLEKSKQGPALVLSLEGKAQEVALQLNSNEISDEAGAQNIITKLNSLYKKDALIEKFNDVESYETYKRPSGSSMKNFIIEFEKRLYKVKSHGIQPSDDLSAYRLLKAANLSSSHEQLVKATINSLSLDEVKTKLSKIFSEDSNVADSMDKITLKEESTFYADKEECSPNLSPGDSEEYSEDEHKTLYTKKFRNNNRYRGNSKQQDQYRANSSTGPKRYTNNSQKPVEQSLRSDDHKRPSNSSSVKGKNPLDKYGNVSRCLNCDSINHWAPNCPDKNDQEQTYIIREIILHQNDLSKPDQMLPEQMKTLVAESWNSGLLDCGVSKTVCGQTWLDEYTRSLSESEQEKIVYHASSSCYKFGDGQKFQAHQGAKIPAYIGNTSVMIKQM